MIRIDLLLMYIKIIYFINFNTKESGSARSRSVRDSDPNKIGSVNQDCPGLPMDDPGKSPTRSRTRGQPWLIVLQKGIIYESVADVEATGMCFHVPATPLETLAPSDNVSRT